MCLRKCQFVCIYMNQSEPVVKLHSVPKVERFSFLCSQLDLNTLCRAFGGKPETMVTFGASVCRQCERHSVLYHVVSELSGFRFPVLLIVNRSALVEWLIASTCFEAVSSVQDAK